MSSFIVGLAEELVAEGRKRLLGLAEPLDALLGTPWTG